MEFVPYNILRQYLGMHVRVVLYNKNITSGYVVDVNGVLYLQEDAQSNCIDIASPKDSKVVSIQLYSEYINDAYEKATGASNVHKDLVLNATNPNHYEGGEIQPIDLITSLGLNYNEGNVVKYICRWRKKNGVEDLKKAIRYIQFEINIAEGRKVRDDPEMASEGT